MTPSLDARTEEVFLAAVELEDSARSAFLDQACAGNPAMRREVVSLLAVAAASEQYFDALAGRIGLSRMVGETPAAGSQRQLGAYRLERLLGRGGMGAVYLAERADAQFEKQVALKVLPIGLGDSVGRARFVAERQILARLVHPNIARLLDGGVTDEGTPYFVMDYVDGAPIDVYCDDNRLDTDSRLVLFCEVCAAVQYAHANLVVHRDLKPANVMVDGDGCVRLLDFGIAKMLDADAADPGLTREGRPLTPMYASPEMLRGEAVTTAADTYALGVLLHVLLCSRAPFRLDGLTGAEIVAVVSDQLPPKPSEVAVQSQPRLAARLRGDLDTIVAKALAKDPRQRYQSAQDLQEDIQRHLARLPVRARAPTLGYRALKFLRRHPAGVASVATATVLMVVIAALAVNYTVTTARQAVIIAEERDRAEQIQQFLLSLFAEADPNQAKGAEVTAREILDRGAERVRSNLGGGSRTRADLSEAIASIYSSLSMHDSAQSLLEESLTLREQVHGAASAEYANTVQALAQLAETKGDYATAESLARQALQTRRQLGEPIGLVSTALRLGTIVHRRGDLDAAESLYREALETARDELGERHDLLASALHALGSLMEHQGRLADSEELHQQGLEIRRELLGDEHLDLIESYYNLGSVQHAQGRFDPAKQNYQHALEISGTLTPDGNADAAYMINALATVHQELGEHELAENRFREALDVLNRYFEADHPNIGIVSANLGMLLFDDGNVTGAEPLLGHALEVMESAIPNHPKLPQVRSTLGRLYAERGSFEAAEPLLAGAYRTLADERGIGDAGTQAAVAALTQLYDAWGRSEDAEQYRALLAQP
jgi:serine/threonine-protein kinase